MTEIYRWLEATSESEGPADRSLARLAPVPPESAPSPALRDEGHGRKREIWLPASSASARAARSIVREAAAEVGLDAERTWDLTLAATEAFANAVEHGEAWPNGCIQFVTEPCPRGLLIEVCDLGTFESTLEPASLEATSGRGMRIIATLVDRLEVDKEEGRTVVRFEKHRDPASRSAAANGNGNGHGAAPVQWQPRLH